MWKDLVTGTIGVMAIGGAAILWIVLAEARNQRWHQILVVSLLITGVAGLLITDPGKWLHDRVDQLAGIVKTWGGEYGLGALITVAAVFLIVVVCKHLWQGRVDDDTLKAAAGVPFLVGSIPGALGTFAVQIVGAPIGATTWLINLAFGIHA